MKLSEKSQEKVTLGIQAVLAVVVISLSVINSAKVESAAMKKAAKKNARALSKLQAKEYKLQAKEYKAHARMQAKLDKEKYKGKMKAAKKAHRGRRS